MAKQTINIGTTADDGTGDPLRTAMDKVNDNFDELYDYTTIDSDITANANVTYSLGNATNQWNHVFANTYHAANAVVFNGGSDGNLTWNETDDCLDITHNDGTTLQTGLENYIQFFNDTGSQIDNGTYVAFAGVYTGGPNNPTVQLMKGDGSIDPLYGIGIATSNVANAAVGRAVVLGKARDIDTTGTDVGESWSAGQLLWANPNPAYAGKLTNVKPTSPNVAISVAAVLSTDATDGEILVRPTTFEQNYYGVFSRSTSNVAPATNTAVPILLDTTAEASEGIEIGSPASRIVFSVAGLYRIGISAEFRSTNASSKDVYLWLRKDGTDVPNSARVFTMTNNGAKRIVAAEYSLSMAATQYVEIYWATTDIAGELYAQAANGFAPAAPSLRVVISQESD